MKFFKVMFTNKGWVKVIRPLSMILLVTFLLTYVSFSWIRREWSPSLEQEGITIATGNTLAFVFDDTVTNTMGTSIDELLGIRNFKLKSVSNLTGNSGDFFSMEVSPAGNQFSTLHHISRSDIANPPSDVTQLNTQLGKEFGYVDVQFTVMAPNNDGAIRYVFIDPTSIFENADAEHDVVSSIRISITLSSGVGDISEGTTYIFGSSDKEHYGINNKTLNNSSIYVVDGAYRYLSELDENGDPRPATSVTVDGQNYDIQLKSAQNNGTGKLYTFDQFDGTSIEKTLFKLENGEQQTITIRIWAEGEDPGCTSEISGHAFNLHLKFEALIIEAEDLT